MKLFTRLILATVLSYPAICMATTWRDIEIDDPIDPTSKCQVQEPASVGSYIYGWPEKYDQVFWPLTDEIGIWFCKNSGFTAFIGDFKNITTSERERIAIYLKENYKGDETIEVKLKLLEDVYSFRNTEEEFDNRLLRVLARWYQNLDKPDMANVYRRRALQGIQLSLKGKLPEAQQLEYLYVAANYSRLFGDIETSDKYVAELRESIAQLRDKELSGFAEYLSELVKETSQIEPGGKLDPERGNET